MTTNFFHGAKVITCDGHVYQNGCIITDGSKIVAVGEGLARPAGAVEHDMTGRIITPGLIDAHTHIGTHVDGYPMGVSDTNEKTDPITPAVRVLDAIYPHDPAFNETLTGGVTCVQTLPGSAEILGGMGAIIKTKPDTIDKMVIKTPSAMKAALGENPIRVFTEKKTAPQTRMGNAWKMREAFVNAKNYRAKKNAAEAKGEPFAKDLTMEAIVDTLEHKMALRVHAHRVDDIQTAVRVAEEFGLKFTVEHCTEGHKIADWLAEHKVYSAVGPTFGNRGKLETSKKSWCTPKALYEAGAHFCIITDHPVTPLCDIIIFAQLAMKAGLPYDEALKAVTIYGAEHLGIEDRVGSITAGKDADLAVWDGDPLCSLSHVVRTYINGELVYER